MRRPSTVHLVFITLLLAIAASLFPPGSFLWATEARNTIGQSTATTPVLGRQNDLTAVKRFATESDSLYSSPLIQKRISAQTAIIIEATSGQPLFAKNADVPRQPASTIKVLTGSLALAALHGYEPVPVSRKAAGQPRSKVNLQADRTYQAEELIGAVLLGSANDASVALAERIAGSEDRFADLMTQLAVFWGARRTVCKTATGLTADGQTSTARDLALIFRQAMRNSDFATRMQQRSMRTSDGQTVYNHNKALWRIDGTTGGKTGYTNAARQTYVGKFKRGSQEIIIAIMGSETMWPDIKLLVRHGFTLAQYLPSPDEGQLQSPKLLADQAAGSDKANAHL